MKRAALAVALVAAMSGAASAGGYIGLGIGTGPSLSSSENEVASNGRSGRLMGGYRISRFSIEGAIGRYDMLMQFEPNGSFYPSQINQGSISGKYNLPLQDNFEVFGRLGFQKTWFTLDDNDRFDASGSGVIVGAGIEYQLKLGLASSSIWFDYQYSRAGLEGEMVRTDLNARMWTLGVTIGF